MGKQHIIAQQRKVCIWSCPLCNAWSLKSLIWHTADTLLDLNTIRFFLNSSQTRNLLADISNIYSAPVTFSLVFTASLSAVVKSEEETSSLLWQRLTRQSKHSLQLSVISTKCSILITMSAVISGSTCWTWKINPRMSAYCPSILHTNSIKSTKMSTWSWKWAWKALLVSQ